MRDQTICMLMVTKPEMIALVNQKCLDVRQTSVCRTLVSLASSDGDDKLKFVGHLVRSISSATIPIARFAAAAVQSVARTPKNGKRKKPAAIVPAVAPVRLQA